MKKLIIALALLVPALAQAGYTHGYMRSNGTYTQGYNHTPRNYTNHDNYSTSGNRNLYTGSTGYRARDYSPQAGAIHQNHAVGYGPQGGQYYNNSRGHRSYVPKY